MTSTSSEPLVLRELGPDAVAEARLGSELRSGGWTRHGAANVRGDAVTEAALAPMMERVRDAARAQGYAAGWAEGRRRATEAAEADARAQARRTAEEREQAAARLATALAALDTAARSTDSSLTGVYDDLSGQAVELALQIAEAVLGRELATAADPGADALTRALTAVPPAAALTLRMHPEDRAVLDLGVLDGHPVTFVDDPGLQRGDAVVCTEDRVVDATVSHALARVREVLAP